MTLSVRWNTGNLCNTKIDRKTFIIVYFVNIENNGFMINVEIYNKNTDTGVIAFNIKGVHPHDAASIYDKNHVCIRAGHHCAQLITSFLGQISTTRASFYLYNTMDDVYKLVDSVKEARDFFKSF